MSGKDDPLGQTTTLWLDKYAMEIARQRYWRAYARMQQIEGSVGSEDIWNLAWAAAVAVHSFINEGRLGPAGGDADSAA